MFSELKQTRVVGRSWRLSLATDFNNPIYVAQDNIRDVICKEGQPPNAQYIRRRLEDKLQSPSWRHHLPAQQPYGQYPPVFQVLSADGAFSGLPTGSS
jgi:hypothetical protein